MDQVQYFDVREYVDLRPACRRFYIVGRRGVGKSYSIKKYLWERFRDHKEKFVYVRRVSPDITIGRMNRVFDDFTETDEDFNPEVMGYGDFYKYHILAKAGAFYLVGETESGELDYLEEMGTITCISFAERFKGGTYINYKNIFFDEFITDGRYIGENEPELFNKILLTVARGNNENVRVFFAGNPDAMIERCPYLFPLKLDYAHMQSNAPYYFDTNINGKVYADNTLFMKIAGGGDEFLNLSVVDAQNSEIEMSITGEVKKRRYFHGTPELLQQLRPKFEMIIETPIIANDEYFKKIYVYLADVYGQPGIVIQSHRRKTPAPTTLYCRYQFNDIRPRKIYQTYRLNIPACFIEARAYMNDALFTWHVVADDDTMAEMFFDILEKK